MVELREGAARNHAPEFAEGPIGPDAVRGFAEPEPHPSAGALDRAGQGAIVDELAADGFDAADFLQSPVADQHASAGRSGGGVARATNPGRRVQQEKEKDEGRRQGAFARSAARDRKSTRLNSSHR